MLIDLKPYMNAAEKAKFTQIAAVFRSPLDERGL